MSVQRSDIVTVARTWVGTPFIKGQRTKGVGCDCSGLVFGVAQELGIQLKDNQLYRGWDKGVFRNMADYVGKQLIPVSVPQIGDVMLFRVKALHKRPTHMGIKTELGMIHTWTGTAGVIEHGLYYFADLFVCAFKYPGIE